MKTMNMIICPQYELHCCIIVNELFKNMNATSMDRAAKLITNVDKK